MESIKWATFKGFIPNLAKKTASEPETQRTWFKAAKFFSGLAENPVAKEFFGTADKGIKTLASVKVIHTIYDNGNPWKNWEKWKADGVLSSVKIIINLANLAINPLLLADTLGFVSLGNAVKPLSVVTTGLDVIERIVNLVETSLKIRYLFGGQGSKYVGHMQQKVTDHADDATKADKWQRRVVAFRMKQGEQFMNIAFYTALLAMHILLGITLLIPGVNVVLPLLIVIGIVTAIGLTKLAWSAATPECNERKFKKLQATDTQEPNIPKLRQVWNVTWSLGYKAPKALYT